jgi:hypothetical protein
MRSATAKPASSVASLALAAGLATAGCASFYEVPIETPLQSKLDVSSFRRIMIVGFVTDASSDAEIDLSAETVRLLQNQLRSSTKLQVLEPDRPPLQDALSVIQARLEEGSGRLSREAQERYQLEADRLLEDTEFWRRLGEEYQTPLIVTGRIGFGEQNRSGFQSEERVVRTPTGSRRVTGNRYIERKGFTLSADFYFVDGRSGQTLHKEKFTEEVLYGDEQRISPLSSYFELMDRLLPNFLGVITPQKIRGTRVLLQ